jgi:hypothetical protein
VDGCELVVAGDGDGIDEGCAHEAGPQVSSKGKRLERAALMPVMLAIPKNSGVTIPPDASRPEALRCGDLPGAPPPPEKAGAIGRGRRGGDRRMDSGRGRDMAVPTTRYGRWCSGRAEIFASVPKTPPWRILKTVDLKQINTVHM